MRHPTCCFSEHVSQHCSDTCNPKAWAALSQWEVLSQLQNTTGPRVNVEKIASGDLWLSQAGTHCPLHPWLGEISRNKACLWPTSTSTLFPDLLAQMMAFSTSVDTATNIAIRKVEAAVVVAEAVRVGGVQRKGKERTVGEVAVGVPQRRSESPSARALHLVSHLTWSQLLFILSWCKYPCHHTLCSSANIFLLISQKEEGTIMDACTVMISVTPLSQKKKKKTLLH